MQKCHVTLVNTIKLSVTSIAGGLFGEELITTDVHEAMGLNDVAQVKAGKLLDCVRTKVDIKSARVHDFIVVLQRNDGEEAAKALEDKILECKISAIGSTLRICHQPQASSGVGAFTSG